MGAFGGYIGRFLAILLLHACLSNAVEWSKFKSCSDLGFCRRHRRFSASFETRYALLQQSLSVSKWHDLPALTGTIKAEGRPDLLLVILAFSNGVFRVIFDDADVPSHPRYIVSDIILPGVQPVSLSEATLQTSDSATKFSLQNAQFYLKISHQPLRVELFSVNSNTALVVLNSNDRLLVEQFTAKPAPSENVSDPTQEPLTTNKDDGNDHAENAKTLPHKSEAQNENESENEKSIPELSIEQEPETPSCDGCWDETFKGHTDPKPRGPESVGLDVAFPFAKHIYGIPERTVKFSVEDTIDKEDKILSEPNRLYNLDVFEFELDQPLGLYGAIPLIYARKGKDSVGLLWLNSAETYVDVYGSETGKRTHWFSETGLIDVFLCVGPFPENVFDQYLWLTGRPAMPQRFALGYHQCRWNYRDDEDVRVVDSGFDKNEMPYDVLWLDIEHTDGKRYFTWDKERFPNPTTLQTHLAARGRKMVTIVDPHVKRDKKYPIHRLGLDQDMYVKKPDGSVYDGWCWPGSSSYFDSTSPRVRQLFSSQFSAANYPHFSQNIHIWNDMNEPSVFNGPEGTMPKEMIHENGTEHRHIHNLYGHYYMQATFEGVRKGHGGNNRPFVLSRSFFAGSQRFGAIWTGDNTAGWDHLRSSVRMLLPLQICGIVLSGADVGGFFGNPGPELLARWYQVGAFQPFYRAHAHLDSDRREPWLFGEPYTGLIAAALRVRYEYIPFWYTLFAGNTLGSDSGLKFSNQGPPMRPMWWEFPEDEESDTNESQWMVGNALLCAPVMSEGAQSQKVYLPGGEIWYDLFAPREGGKKIDTCGGIELPVTLERMLVFQRGGSIIPKQMRRRRSTAAMTGDPYTIVVALDKESKAKGEMYLDDGKTYDFKSGCFTVRRFLMKNDELEASVVGGDDCRFDGRETTIERIVILGYGPSPPKEVMEGARKVDFVHSDQTEVLTLQRVNVDIATSNWKLIIISP